MKYRKANKAKRLSSHCANHGSCKVCLNARLHQTNKQLQEPVSALVEEAQDTDEWSLNWDPGDCIVGLDPQWGPLDPKVRAQYGLTVHDQRVHMEIIRESMLTDEQRAAKMEKALLQEDVNYWTAIDSIPVSKDVEMVINIADFVRIKRK